MMDIKSGNQSQFVCIYPSCLIRCCYCLWQHPLTYVTAWSIRKEAFCATHSNRGQQILFWPVHDSIPSLVLLNVDGTYADFFQCPYYYLFGPLQFGYHPFSQWDAPAVAVYENIQLMHLTAIIMACRYDILGPWNNIYNTTKKDDS
jgi:hypothetical protein